jgi:hypothetical protein
LVHFCLWGDDGGLIDFGIGNTSTNAPTTTGFGGGSLCGINTGASKPSFGTTTNTTSGGLFGQNQQTTTNTTSGGLFGQNQQQQQLNQSQFSQSQQPQQLAPWESGLEPQLQLDPALMVDVPGDMLFEDIEKKHPQLASWILNVELVPLCGSMICR